MSPVEWYYARGNKQFGPISAVELRQLADTGQLKSEDLVWREGLGQWLPAGKVKGLFEEPAPPPASQPVAGPPRPAPPQPAPTSGGGSTFETSAAAFERAREGPPRHFFDRLLDFARKQFPAQLVDSTSVMFAVAGHYGLYAAMGAFLLYDVLTAVKDHKYSSLPLTAVWIIALLVFQYVARRMLGTLDKLNRETPPASMASTGFLDSCALASVFLGLAGLVGLALLALLVSRYSLILVAMLVFVLCEYLAMLALNPETLNVSIRSDTSFPEEAIGALFAPMSVSLRLAPVFYGAGVALGTLGMLYACVLLFVKLEPEQGGVGGAGLAGLSALSGLSELGSLTGAGAGDLGLPSGLASALRGLQPQPAHEVTASAARWGVICSAAVPWLTYLFLVFYHLFVGIARAIIGVGRVVLPLPGKSDRLPDQQEASKEE